MSSLAAAPWIAVQTTALLRQRGHAWLLAGPSGLGQYSLALALARAWLCDRPNATGACGACPSCHAVDVRAHADLCVLMPETAMLALQWPLSEQAAAEVDDKKRKPSKEIRVDSVREAVGFAQRTSARGRGKVVLVFPAERMNQVTANALLKTLEEPVGDVRFVLASEAAHLLLPTIRSRCQTHAMLWPEHDAAVAWLQGQGVAADQASTLLKVAGGRPDDAWRYFQNGPNAMAWRGFAKAMAQGDVSAVQDWAPAQLVDALHKLCYDLLAVSNGAAPRFFDAAALPTRGLSPVLSRWAKALSRTACTVEHPFNAGLMLEALVSQAKNAINSRETAPVHE